MKITVLGAGVIGVTSAWYLAAAGHEVTVVKRQAGAGLETSFANGGQISPGNAEPWANFGALASAINWLGKELADASPRWSLVFFRPRPIYQKIYTLRHPGYDTVRAIMSHTRVNV